MGNKEDPSALDELVRALYSDLHRIAARHIRGERPGHTLQATALLHEAYVKLSDDGQRQFSDKAHFLSVASRVMRQVLVDYARARATKKRAGGDRVDDGQDDVEEASFQLAATRGMEPIDILELDRALDSLALDDPLLAQLIEMRYFGGLTAQESAEFLGRSVHIVRHDLRLAQAWLRRELQKKP